MHPPHGRPTKTLIAQIVNERLDFRPAHAVDGFWGRTRCHGALVGVQAPIGTQIQLRVVEERVYPLQRQSSSAAVANDGQYRFSVLHSAYLPTWASKSPTALRPVRGFPALRGWLLVQRLIG